MGAGIAAHLANAGFESLLFDIVPKDAGESEEERSAYAIKGLQGLKKIKPAALYNPRSVSLIRPCNYEDHGALLSDCDWIIEVVVERLDIKQKVFSWVAEHRSQGSIVSSNTSGIPLVSLVEGMSDEMRSHFLVTHFFNPVRYMRLLELVAGPDTNREVVERIADFGENELGKGIVFGKDTPNFVANRIGTFGMASVFHHLEGADLTIDMVDMIFGTPMGRAKSAIFRTADIVGLDTLVHVFGTVYDKAPDDEKRDWFRVPRYLTDLVESGRTGQKAGAGFFKKTRVDGKRQILSLNLNTGEYEPRKKEKFASVGAAKRADGSAASVAALVWGDDAAADLAWKVTADTLIYAGHRIPEIADDIVNVDRAMRWGFGWDLGPFETWDAIGVARAVERMDADGLDVPQWVKQMLESGRSSFYDRDADGNTTFWKVSGDAAPQATSARSLFLRDLKATGQEVERNVSASLLDMGDGILCLEFHSKLNALDEQIFQMYSSALDKLEAGEFNGLVVGNQDGKAYCAGANLLMILMGAMQKQWDTIEGSIKQLQDLLMRAKYSKAPVVTAPYGLTLGGGCEVAMQSAATVAGAELYMGLVEVGVGLIPGGGGCKEMVFRQLGGISPDVAYDPGPFVAQAFEQIGLAKVSSSAEEARRFGTLRQQDRVILNPDHLLSEAKRVALGLVTGGYQPPRPSRVRLPGRSGSAAIELFLYQMAEGGHATEHDVTIGKRLAHILTGGDVPSGTMVSEQQLLDLEREVFLSLCGEEKTVARIQHMLQTNKPLRN